jgi:hypothetical protein
VSLVFGMVKNESERDDCTSILFNAFRMELNLIILYPNSNTCTHEILNGELLGNSSRSSISSGSGIMILCSAGAYQMNPWFYKE